MPKLILGNDYNHLFDNLEIRHPIGRFFLATPEAGNIT